MAARSTDFRKSLKYLQGLQSDRMVYSDIKNIRPRQVNVSIEPRRFNDFMAMDAYMRYEPFMGKTGCSDDDLVALELFFEANGSISYGTVTRDRVTGGRPYVYGYNSKHREDVSKTVDSLDELLKIFGRYYSDELSVLTY